MMGCLSSAYQTPGAAAGDPGGTAPRLGLEGGVTRLMHSHSDPCSVDRPGDLATYDARELIPNGSTAHVVLDGQIYTLRITRAGKLILTK